MYWIRDNYLSCNWIHHMFNYIFLSLAFFLAVMGYTFYYKHNICFLFGIFGHFSPSYFEVFASAYCHIAQYFSLTKCFMNKHRYVHTYLYFGLVYVIQLLAAISSPFSLRKISPRYFFFGWWMQKAILSACIMKTMGTDLRWCFVCFAIGLANRSYICALVLFLLHMFDLICFTVLLVKLCCFLYEM